MGGKNVLQNGPTKPQENITKAGGKIFYKNVDVTDQESVDNAFTQKL